MPRVPWGVLVISDDPWHFWEMWIFFIFSAFHVADAASFLGSVHVFKRLLASTDITRFLELSALFFLIFAFLCNCNAFVCFFVIFLGIVLRPSSTAHTTSNHHPLADSVRWCVSCRVWLCAGASWRCGSRLPDSVWWIHSSQTIGRPKFVQRQISTAVLVACTVFDPDSWPIFWIFLQILGI